MAGGESSRRNNAIGAYVHRDEVFAQGSFKVVYRGTYREGGRAGQACVVKEMRSGSTFHESAFDKEVEVVARTIDIVEKFNQAGHINRRILVNRPEVWTYTNRCTPDIAGAKHLVEPFIENFQKFNSNTGWVLNDDQGWTKAMQALSHFSYHCSSGQFVLCDLQGGIYRHEAVLTDPVVHSRDRRYGPTDLGYRGIEHFFHQHRCNEYCALGWQKPANCRGHGFPVCMGTSMVDQDGRLLVPTRTSRSALQPTGGYHVRVSAPPG